MRLVNAKFYGNTPIADQKRRIPLTRPLVYVEELKILPFAITLSGLLSLISDLIRTVEQDLEAGIVGMDTNNFRTLTMVKTTMYSTALLGSHLLRRQLTMQARLSLQDQALGRAQMMLSLETVRTTPSGRVIS